MSERKCAQNERPNAMQRKANCTHVYNSQMNDDPNWLKEKAAQEDGCAIGAGIDQRELTTDELLGLLDPVLADYSVAVAEIRRRLEETEDLKRTNDVLRYDVALVRRTIANLLEKLGRSS